MLRKALLISNCGESNADNYCKGVRVDIDNYKAFLTSPLGGAWFSTEIIHMDRPSCTRVDEVVAELRSYDYSFILFSGHGFFSNVDQSTILELRHNEYYVALDLRNGATKRTIILDCCRKVYPDRAFVLDEMVKAMLKMAKPPLSLARCRSHFDSKVQECSNGFVVGNSCKIGEESGESELSGGFYASSLLKVANDWYSNEEHDLDNYRYTKNIVNAHNSAIELVKTLNDEQNPYLDRSSRSGPYFPFAVMRS